MRLLAIGLLVNSITLAVPWPFTMRGQVQQLQADVQFLQEENRKLASWAAWLHQREKTLNAASAHFVEVQHEPRQ